MASVQRVSPGGQLGHSSKTATLSQWRDVARVLAGAVIALGVVVLFGWGLDVPELTNFLQRATPTWPLTACLLIFSGIALYLSSTNGRLKTASTLIALAIGSVALVIVASHLAGIARGYENLLFQGAVRSTRLPNAGRPAILTAFGLMGFSAALVWMNRGQMVRSQQSASLVVLLAWTALTGYLYSAPNVYGNLTGGHLSLYSACAFMLLGIGIFATQPSAGLMRIITRDSPSRSTLVRLWLMSLALMLLLGWGASIAQSANIASPATVLALFVAGNAVLISMLIGGSALALQHLEVERQWATERLLASENHLRNLQFLTATLARAMSVNEAATMIAQEGSKALVSDSAIVVIVQNDDASTNIVHCKDFPDEALEAWSRLAERTPLRDAMLQKDVLLIDSAAHADTNDPSHSRSPELHHTWAILPLIHDNHAFGAAGFAFAQRKSFSSDDRSFLLAMAEQCGQAVARAKLHEATQRHAKTAGFLATLSHALTRAHDLEARADVLAKMIVPEIADWCTINMLEPSGHMRLIGVAHIRPEGVEWIRAWSRRHPIQMNGDLRLQSVMNENHISYFSQVDEAILQQIAGGEEDALQWLRASDTGSMVEVALASHDKTFGMMKLVRTNQRAAFTLDEVAFIRDVAQDAAWALDNAQLFQAAMISSQTAERNAERTQRLQTVTALLNKAQTVRQVTESMVSQGIEAMGARAGFIALFTEKPDGSADRNWLRIVAQRGYDVNGRESSLLPAGRFPVSASTPVNLAIQQAAPVWVASVQELFVRFPASARLLAQRDQAWACVPLLYEQRVLGGLALSFESPKEFDAEDQALFIALAQQCAQALERARLLTAEQKLNGELKDALAQVVHDEQVQRLLASAGEVLSAPLDVEQRIDNAVRLFVQHLADWCTIEILDQDGRLVQQAVAHARTNLQPALDRLREEFPPVSEGRAGISHVLKTGEPMLYAVIDELILQQMSRNAKHSQLLRELGCCSGMMLPLSANGALLGTMSFMRGDGAPAYTQNDLAVACDLAIRLGMAIENARLFEETRALNQHLEKRVADRTAELEQSNEQLRESRRQLRELSRQTLSLVEQERAHVVREVHDELGQSLASVKMALSRAERNLGASNNGHVHNSIQSAIEMIDETIKSIRDLAANLRPVVLDDLGLVAAIEWQMREFEHKTGIYCDFSSEVDAGVVFSHDVSTAAFRILQEALNNVSRHAQASEVRVTMVANSSGLMLSIRDNGKGMRVEAPAATYGLLSMHERALQLNGQLDVQSAPNHGTSLVLMLPLRAEAQRQPQ